MIYQIELYYPDLPHSLQSLSTWRRRTKKRLTVAVWPLDWNWRISWAGQFFSTAIVSIEIPDKEHAAYLIAFGNFEFKLKSAIQYLIEQQPSHAASILDAVYRVTDGLT